MKQFAKDEKNFLLEVTEKWRNIFQEKLQSENFLERNVANIFLDAQVVNIVSEAFRVQEEKIEYLEIVYQIYIHLNGKTVCLSNPAHSPSWEIDGKLNTNGEFLYNSLATEFKLSPEEHKELNIFLWGMKFEQLIWEFENIKEFNGVLKNLHEWEKRMISGGHHSRIRYTRLLEKANTAVSIVKVAGIIIASPVYIPTVKWMDSSSKFKESKTGTVILKSLLGTFSFLSSLVIKAEDNIYKRINVTNEINKSL